MHALLNNWPEVVAAVIGFLLSKIGRKRAPAGGNPSRPRWTPNVANAKEAPSDYDFDRNGRVVDHSVAVRIRKGKQTLVIGAIPISEDDFEEKLNTLVANAEERAAAMNAAEDVLA